MHGADPVIPVVLIEDGQPRTIDITEFPLAVGLSGTTLRVGVAAEAAPVAWILAHPTGVALQPERSRTRVRYNDGVLDKPAWLKAGDRIAVGSQILTVGANPESEGLVLTVVDPKSDPQFQRLGTPLSVAGKRRGLATPKKIALALFTLLFLGVAYVVTASALHIRIAPGADAMSVRGFPPAIPFAGRYLVLPGDYVVEANKEGYRPLERTVSVPYGETSVFEFVLEKLPGRLQITTPPVDGANILIDGTERGISPLTLDIEAGPREIRVTSERYLPETRQIDVAGMGRSQALEIPLRPGWGTLSVATAPAAARARVDGKDIGETPLTADVLQGKHELELAKPGWKPVTRAIEIQASVALSIPAIELERIDGTIELTSNPAGATVMVDGQFRGQTPVSLALVGEREYQLILSKAGYEENQRKVHVDGGKSVPLAVSLPPELGTVFLTADPAGTTLLLNGRPSGSGTQRLTLQTLPQTIEITKPGYEPFKTIVTPQRGVPKRIDVALKTPGEALKERAGKGIFTPGKQRLALILITAPTQVMVGASRRDPARRSNEAEYPVRLTRSFLISEKEITNDEYWKFRSSHSAGTYQSTSLDVPEQPAVNVTWDDAARYANWLSTQEGLNPAYKEQDGKVVPVVPLTNGYRLPTEAEWEFAARYDGGKQPSGQPLQFPWGASMPPPANSGNYAHEGTQLPFAIPGYTDDFLASAPVGKFAANKSLIYDLGGNVSEWCHDFYDVAVASSEPKVDPAGPTAGRFHVIKGASWRTGSAADLRLAYRDYADKPRDDLGFRVVRYVAAKP